jgi:dTDP-4-dehydrorhamnose reductase
MRDLFLFPMLPTVIITGATGRLGGALARRWQSSCIQCPGRAELDFSLHETELWQQLERLPPAQVLIHCAAMTSPDLCEQQPERAWRINAEAPATLACFCQQRDMRLVHISTDYVFSGQVPGPLTESATCTQPVSVYGRSKRAAEEAILALAPEHSLISRVCWLYGGDKPSFPEQMLQQAQTGQLVQAIADKWSVPTAVEDLAAWLEQLITQAWSPGIWHLCPSGQATWQEYAQASLDLAHELGWLPQPVSVAGTLLRDFSHFKAERPVHTVMSSARLAQALNQTLPSWRESLRQHWLRQKRP